MAMSMIRQPGKARETMGETEELFYETRDCPRKGTDDVSGETLCALMLLPKPEDMSDEDYAAGGYFGWCPDDYNLDTTDVVHPKDKACPRLLANVTADLAERTRERDEARKGAVPEGWEFRELIKIGNREVVVSFERLPIPGDLDRCKWFWTTGDDGYCGSEDTCQAAVAGAERAIGEAEGDRP